MGNAEQPESMEIDDAVLVEGGAFHICGMQLPTSLILEAIDHAIIEK